MSTCKSVMYISDVSVFLTTTIRAVVSLPAFKCKKVAENNCEKGGNIFWPKKE